MPLRIICYKRDGSASQWNDQSANNIALENGISLMEGNTGDSAQICRNKS